MGRQIDDDAYQDEFTSLANKALEDAQIGFMHRDFQSRNIMIKNESVYLIDFQGGRLGPLQYDLASLLIDPYAVLPASVQARLLDYCIEKLGQRVSVDAHKFRRCYQYCCLTRNLQILGAFGFLSKVRQKRYFEHYIPAAVKSLTTNLTVFAGAEFPKLEGLVRKITFNSPP